MIFFSITLALITRISAFSINPRTVRESNFRLGLGRDFASNEEDLAQQSRRSMMRYVLNQAAIVAAMTADSQPSYAGLVQFPCDYNLMNTYHFMRAGESLLEGNGFLSTNPLFMTNREDSLSPLGMEQVLNACDDLRMKNIDPSVVKYSIAAKSIDTANVVANELKVGRNRLVPEYTYMDPRGVGIWNMRSLADTEEAVWAMDDLEAGADGKEGRPPPNDDGTANETLSEQAVRLRQLMSILETHFSGDTILLIFGDGTSPALLMALIAGIPLNRVHELNFNPGEIRYDINRDNVLAFMPTVKSPAYLKRIAHGEETLKGLREELKKPVVEEGLGFSTTRRSIAVTKKTKEKSKPRSSQIESDKSSVEKTYGPKDSSTEVSLGGLAIPLLSIGMYGAASSGGSKDGDNERIEEDPLIIEEIEIPYPSETSDKVVGEGVTLISSNINNEVVERTGVSLSPELERLENLVETAPFEIPEMSRNYDDDDDDSKEEKIQKAKDAMDEYMSQDDGGEDWLAQVSLIMDDDY